MAAIALETQRPQVPAPVQPELPQKQPIQQDFFPKLKENAVWAWNVTLEKLQALGAEIKQIVLKVIEAVHEFFAPKVQVARKSMLGAFDWTVHACGPATHPPGNTAPPVQEKQAVDLPPHQQEEPKPDPQIFIPAPLQQELPHEDLPLQVQMPILPQQHPLPKEEPLEEKTPPLQAAPPEPPKGERMGIFYIIASWFGWK